MTKIPDAGYMSSASRTQQNMKDALEDLRSVVQEVGGGEDDDSVNTLTIALGVTPVPTSAYCAILSEEGLDSDDDLIGITTTDLPFGRVIHIVNSDDVTTSEQTTASSETSGEDGVIVVKHSAVAEGRIRLSDGNDFMLSGQRSLSLVLLDSGSVAYWQEIGRSWGRVADADAEKTNQRTWLGLGTAATETVATAVSEPGKLLVTDGSGVAVNKLLMMDSVGKITGGPAEGDIDAGTLGTLASDKFIQTDETGVQAVAGTLTSGVTIAANQSGWNTSGGEANKAKLELRLGGSTRGSIVSTAGSTTAASTEMDIQIVGEGEEAFGAGLHIDGPTDTLERIKNSQSVVRLLDADDLTGSITDLFGTESATAVVGTPTHDPGAGTGNKKGSIVIGTVKIYFDRVFRNAESSAADVIDLSSEFDVIWQVICCMSSSSGENDSPFAYVVSGGTSIDIKGADNDDRAISYVCFGSNAT